MAYEGPAIYVPGAIAGAGLTGATVQFKFVRFSADGTVILVSAATQVPCGVLQAPANCTGDAVSVMAVGISKVRLAAGSPAAGDLIGADSNGDAASLSIPAATSYQAGQLIEVCSATDEGTIGTALIDCSEPSRGA